MEVIFNLLSHLLSFGILLIIFFFVMKAAVKSAIGDMNDAQGRLGSVVDELIKLRDIELLSNDELEEVIEIYKDENVKKENYEEYAKYAAILEKLKEREYFNHEQYAERSNRLKEHYNIDQ